MCALICMRLGKTEQKIFAHSAILKVVMIPLEKIERMRIEREEVSTLAATKGNQAEGQ